MGPYEGRIRGIWAPTQTMTCTPAMLKEVRKRADKMNMRITIHGAEAPIELSLASECSERHPVQLMADTGCLEKM